MRVWTCVDHDSHWPVGCASVIVADGELEARVLLDAKLKEGGLKGSDAVPYALAEVDTSQPLALILCDGDY